MRIAIVEKNCVACGACVKKCPVQAIKMFKGIQAQIDPAMCKGCGLCEKTCPAGQIEMKEKVQQHA